MRVPLSIAEAEGKNKPTKQHMNYRDSYYQSQHFLESYHCLYNEWNKDEFPITEEKLEDGSNKNNDEATHTGGTSNIAGGSKAGSQGYWDYFHDEADWELFKNQHLESNGVVTFNIDSTTITGSIFNKQRGVTNFARQEISNWKDWALYVESDNGRVPGETSRNGQDNDGTAGPRP